MPILVIQGFALVVRALLQDRLADAGAGRFAADLSYLAVPPLLAIMLWPIVSRYRVFLAETLDPARLTWRLAATAILVGVLLRVAFWAKLVGMAAVTATAPAPLAATLAALSSIAPSIAAEIASSTISAAIPADAIGASTLAGAGAAGRPDVAVDGPSRLSIGFACPAGTALALHIVARVVMAPVVEEIINRGFFLFGLLRKGKIVAVFASGALFAAFHPVATMDTAFVSGIAFGALTLRTGSLWPAVLAHGAFNALIILDWLCLSVTWNPVSATPATHGLTAGALFVCAAAIGAVTFLILNAKAVPGPKPRHLSC